MYLQVVFRDYTELARTQTSGAKLLSSHTGVDTLETLSDVGVATYNLQKRQTSPFRPMAAVSEEKIHLRLPGADLPVQVIPVNTQIIDFAEANGIRSYIVVPPMVCEVLHPSHT